MPTTTVKTYRIVGGRRIWDLDRNAKKRFPFNWSKWLAAEGPAVAIASVQFVIDTNITQVQAGNDATTASILLQLTDPALNVLQTVTCRITTNETPPQIQDSSIYINPIDE